MSFDNFLEQCKKLAAMLYGTFFPDCFECFMNSNPTVFHAKNIYLYSNVPFGLIM